MAHLATYLLYLSSHHGIGNVPKVPCYQIVDSVRNGNGYVRSVVGRFSWNRPEFE